MMNLLDVLTKTWICFFPIKHVYENPNFSFALPEETSTENGDEFADEPKFPQQSLLDIDDACIHSSDPEELLLRCVRKDLRLYSRNSLALLGKVEFDSGVDVDIFNDNEINTFTEMIEADEIFLAQIISALHSLQEDRIVHKLYRRFVKSFQENFSYPGSLVCRAFGFGFKMVMNKEFFSLRCDARSTSHERGWKIHISIDDTDRENLIQAWNVVLEHIFEYQIGRTKIVNLFWLQQDAERSPCEIGKQVTIYCDDKLSIIDWIVFMDKLTRALIRRGIKSGCHGLHVNYLNEYIGLRYDAYPDGEYRWPYVGPYKPEEIHDPFKCWIKRLGFLNLQLNLEINDVEVSTSEEDTSIKSQSSNKGYKSDNMTDDMRKIGFFSSSSSSTSEETAQSSETSSTDNSESTNSRSEDSEDPNNRTTFSLNLNGVRYTD